MALKYCLLLFFLLVAPLRAADFIDTCTEEKLAEQKKAVDAKLTPERRLNLLDPLAKEISGLYSLKVFPKDFPKPYIMNCLKVKNKIVSDHVNRGGAPFRGRPGYNLTMGHLEESRKNNKAALVYFDKARKLLPLDVEVAFKAADTWILTQIAEQNNKNLKANKKSPEWLRLEKEFILRFSEIEKNPAATVEHKSRARTALGRFYQGADEHPKATEHYNKALEYDPKNEKARDFLKALGSS